LFKIVFIIFSFVCANLFGQAYQPTSKEKKMSVSTPSSEPSPPACPSVSKESPKWSSSTLQVGVTGSYVSISPSSYSTTRGNLVGISGTYAYQKSDNLYAGVRAVWSQGTTHGGGTSRSILNLILEERIGYTWSSMQRESLISLFSGFGGRSLRELVKVHPSSVTFDYLEWYFPLGVSFLCRPCDWLVIGVLGEWMAQIYPTVRIAPLDGARWILNTELLNFLLQFPVGVVFSNLSFTIEPFVELWHDGHVSAETENGISLHLPGNRYFFAGLNLNLGISF